MSCVVVVGVVAVVVGPRGSRVALDFLVYRAVRLVSSFFDICKISSMVSIQALVHKIMK